MTAPFVACSILRALSLDIPLPFRNRLMVDGEIPCSVAQGVPLRLFFDKYFKSSIKSNIAEMKDKVNQKNAIVQLIKERARELGMVKKSGLLNQTKIAKRGNVDPSIISKLFGGAGISHINLFRLLKGLNLINKSGGVDVPVTQEQIEGLQDKIEELEQKVEAVNPLIENV